MIFRKTVLVVATVSACSSLALADEKVPSLGDVLKSSGITESGYIDYSYIDRSTDQNSPTYRNYDNEQRGFTLQMLDLTVGYLPASGFGGQVELNYGSDAKVNSGAADPTTAKSNTDVQQVYMQYASGPFSVMAGKYDTLAGAEVIQAPSNTNFSRSLLFTFAEPAFHTGVRGAYALSDTTKFTVGINNGWNVNEKSYKPAVGTPAKYPTGNTAELGVSLAPVKILSLSGAYYSGQESGLTAAGTRSLLDLVATINATDALSFVLNYDDDKQDHGKANGTAAKWDGLAGYVNFKFSDMWRISFRTEKLKDKDGFATGTTQTLKENTLTVGFDPASSFELRGEFRADKSDKNVFLKSASATDKQHTLALEGVYKF
ncbi:MAG: outer membrane beta-barrel protein [Sulfuricaulis sp.]